MVSNFCSKLKMLAELCCYHNLLNFGFMARLCPLGCLQLIFMVAMVSPLNWDFLDYSRLVFMIARFSPLNWDFLGCSELMIEVSLARIPFIGISPGCMALASTIKAKMVS